MYNRPITYLTRWATVGTVVTILLNGCASTPPTPIPTPIPENPPIGTGTSSSPDVGTITSGNPTDGTTTLPSNPTPSSTTTTTSPDDDASYHTVSPKETLYSIAKQYVRMPAEIKKWNNLTSDKLSIGQRLRVAPPAGDSASSTSPPASACHKVVRGDTLYSIAKHYGHKVADVAKWNGIKNPSTYHLKVGQMLQTSSDGSCQ